MGQQNQLRRRIAGCALELFDRQGFAATSVDQIAAAAGVSRRTFFRHFPRKESVILFEQELYRTNWRERLADRPPNASTFDLFVTGARQVILWAARDRARRDLRARMIRSTPALASVERDADAEIAQMFADAYGAELGGRPQDRVRASIVGAALIAAINAVDAECLDPESAVELFDKAVRGIVNGGDAISDSSVVVVLRAPSSLSNEDIIARLERS
ncbi:TetR family transcriptional regulator [Sphingomonas sp. CL5.1]|uniref:TetR/AcrR family transcriptional regulator n=1 Tax=Sphingomonas sp. CL5.1 TaxID=2653203 RepID=UPI0015816A00|nr:TetR/AcrR family transcriptional regulator [Sphingomonas sp. CL5.1]QKS00464.1 TetR family transcriptional regulator [Sphingomonas sp. CL5.1]